jgi:hypothetical protein
MEILKRLREAVRRKRPELWPQYLDSPPWQRSSSQGVLSSSFWLKSGLLNWNTYPIPPIWLRMTSGYF